MGITRILAGAAIGLASSGAALAGPLLITPTTVQFAPDRRSALIEVTNQSDDAVDLQFRAFVWSQAEDRERLEPAADLVVSPPITTVPAHGRQVFRILDTGSTQGVSERSYRLKLNELPRASASGIRINVEFSLPVFVTPARASPAALSADVDGGAIRLVNGGERHVRLSSLVVHQAHGGEHVIAEARGLYLLAGASRRIALPRGVRPDPGARLIATTDMGRIDVPLAALAAR